mgnify:CR=1 FL=1
MEMTEARKKTATAKPPARRPSERASRHRPQSTQFVVNMKLGALMIWQDAHCVTLLMLSDADLKDERWTGEPGEVLGAVVERMTRK